MSAGLFWNITGSFPSPRTHKEHCCWRCICDDRICDVEAAFFLGQTLLLSHLWRWSSVCPRTNAASTSQKLLQPYYLWVQEVDCLADRLSGTIKHNPNVYLICETVLSPCVSDQALRTLVWLKKKMSHLLLAKEQLDHLSRSYISNVTYLPIKSDCRKMIKFKMVAYMVIWSCISFCVIVMKLWNRYGTI